MAGLRRDRHYGEHRQGTVDGAWDAARTRVSAGGIFGGLHVAERAELCRRLPHFCRGMGAAANSSVCGRNSLCDRHAKWIASTGQLAVQYAAVLFAVEF